jgi:hypothetical protein
MIFYNKIQENPSFLISENRENPNFLFGKYNGILARTAEN